MRIVSLLVVTAIIILATIYMIKGNPGAATRPDGKGTTTLGRTLNAAKDEKCMNNLSQCRSFISIATDPVDEVRPPDLASAKVPPDMQKCSIDPFEPYIYDPATGRVSCPHPGHEKY